MIKCIRLLGNPLLPLLKYLHHQCFSHFKPFSVSLAATLTCSLLAKLFQLDMYEPLNATGMRYPGEFAALRGRMIAMCALALSVPILQAAFKIVRKAYFYFPKVFLVPENVNEAVFLLCRVERLGDPLEQGGRYAQSFTPFWLIR